MRLVDGRWDPSKGMAIDGCLIWREGTFQESLRMPGSQALREGSNKKYINNDIQDLIKCLYLFSPRFVSETLNFYSKFEAEKGFVTKRKRC